MNHGEFDCAKKAEEVEEWRNEMQTPCYGQLSHESIERYQYDDPECVEYVWKHYADHGRPVPKSVYERRDAAIATLIYNRENAGKSDAAKAYTEKWIKILTALEEHKAYRN